MSQLVRTAVTHLITFSLLFMLSALAYGESLDVRINNFSETQQIRGSVSIEGSAKSVKLEGLIVSPSRRIELSEVLHAGKIDTEGFNSISVVLQGEI